MVLRKRSSRFWPRKIVRFWRRVGSQFYPGLAASKHKKSVYVCLAKRRSVGRLNLRNSCVRCCENAPTNITTTDSVLLFFGSLYIRIAVNTTHEKIYPRLISRDRNLIRHFRKRTRLSVRCLKISLYVSLYKNNKIIISYSITRG